jgi:hypothetical protein
MKTESQNVPMVHIVLVNLRGDRYETGVTPDDGRLPTSIRHFTEHGATLYWLTERVENGRVVYSQLPMTTYKVFKA